MAAKPSERAARLARLYEGLLGGDGRLNVSTSRQRAIDNIPDGSMTAVKGGQRLTLEMRKNLTDNSCWTGQSHPEALASRRDALPAQQQGIINEIDGLTLGVRFQTGLTITNCANRTLQFCSGCYDIGVIATCTTPGCRIAVCYYKKVTNEACISDGESLDTASFRCPRCFMKAKELINVRSNPIPNNTSTNTLLVRNA